MTTQYYSNGKLLISAEYAILDGATGLALPTRYGQSLTVSRNNNSQLNWVSKDHNGSVWFEAQFKTNDFHILKGESETADKLKEILEAARVVNPDFTPQDQGFNVVTQMDFGRDWGLGSSSTLINNIATWAGIDAYELLRRTFGGSGYDIACAQHNTAIIYRLEQDLPVIQEIRFDPPFKNELYFIYLNKKKNSRDGIALYSALKPDKSNMIRKLSALSKEMAGCQNLKNFELLMSKHEAILSDILKVPTVKETLFSDYPFAIKSLGAWGGDFIMAVGNEHTTKYFKDKGYDTVIPYPKMILV